MCKFSAFKTQPRSQPDKRSGKVMPKRGKMCYIFSPYKYQEYPVLD
ncbi:Uncharacterised protein [Vibrio cholerae]|nr:Uncharacterised protein [Vibrio cholerae]